ncbi:hypothetical protein L1987_52048 [Smallanthus sonchifolius]|uniref:Uncharacterized protein n=1 Tax=Smallanthus sonchifolius TaxID=185202 RepID=A0ACB9ES14_9ASTR|nr:hypothetical protein L1987_52048 [Smallanthus sonchifolius]
MGSYLCSSSGAHPLSSDLVRLFSDGKAEDTGDSREGVRPKPDLQGFPFQLVNLLDEQALLSCASMCELMMVNK